MQGVSEQNERKEPPSVHQPASSMYMCVRVFAYIHTGHEGSEEVLCSAACCSVLKSGMALFSDRRPPVSAPHAVHRPALGKSRGLVPDPVRP